jgi:hypothetical protein
VLVPWGLVPHTRLPPLRVVAREGNVQSTPNIAATLPAAVVSCAIDAAPSMPCRIGEPQQSHQQISAVKRPSAPFTPATCHFAFAMSRVRDDGNDLCVRADRTAPDNPAEQDHLYLHFNEWSRAQQK